MKKMLIQKVPLTTSSSSAAMEIHQVLKILSFLDSFQQSLSVEVELNTLWDQTLMVSITEQYCAAESFVILKK